MRTDVLFKLRAHRLRILTGLASLALATSVQASFHFMQIEQVIGGVNGDTTAQAVQLRMRAQGQNLINGGEIVAFNAAGTNPIVLVTFPTSVPIANTGSRILITSPSFAAYEETPIASDFTMTNTIPASYFAAGKIVFRKGSTLWSLAWGGAGYTGSNSGTTDNDADGNFSPPFPGALPSSSTSSLRFKGTAGALSTNNADDYLIPGVAAIFTNNAGDSTSLISGPPPPSTLGNISTRLRVQTGDNALIGGMIATGTAGKRVIVRAIGPALSDLGVPGALMNPTLELFQESTLLFSNDDWNLSSQEGEIVASGFAPTDPAESAIIWTLTPGQNYTAVVRGVNGTTGVGIVEAYDLDHAAASKLGNISTRGFVEVGDNAMIAGLIVRPANGTNARILVRALGPTLSELGVPGALPDPALDLVNSSGTVVRSNNNWMDDPQQQTEIEAAGLAPGHDEEAAVVETVAPGSYTAIVRGSGSTPTGVGLVEVYHLP
jgi:hypothetical protein